MKENKRIIITSIIVAICVIATLGATYAYFQAIIGTGSSTSTTIKAQTIDGLTFTNGSALTLTATQTNFASGSGDLYAGTASTVTLKARSDEAASYNYTACLNITENTFVHSQVSTTDQGLGTMPNLLDITKIKNNMEDDYYTINLQNSKDIGTLKELCPNCKAGRSYVIYDDLNSSNRWIGLTNVADVAWSFAHENVNTGQWTNSRTLTEDDLNSPVRLNSGTYEGLQIVDATNYPRRTAYEPGGGYIAGAELSVKIMSGGNVLLEKDITNIKGDICVPTTKGGTDYTHTISASAGGTKSAVWVVELTLNNYNNNQNINLEKKFKATFDLKKV